MRQVFLALLLLIAGIVLLGMLYLGMSPPKPHVQQVDHAVPLSGAAH